MSTKKTKAAAENAGANAAAASATAPASPAARGDAQKFPTAGRVVLFNLEGGGSLPAIVTSSTPGIAVKDEKGKPDTTPPAVSVEVFGLAASDPTRYQRNIHEGTGPGSWSWPPRG